MISSCVDSASDTILLGAEEVCGTGDAQNECAAIEEGTCGADKILLMAFCRSTPPRY